jgi:hypothetical protein
MVKFLAFYSDINDLFTGSFGKDSFKANMYESIAISLEFRKSLKQVISYTFGELAHFLKTQKIVFVYISASSSLISMNFFLNCRAKLGLQNKKNYWMLRYLQKTIF